MKTIIFLSISIFLTACQPTQTKINHDQLFVCKSLISGYLNALQLKQFDFSKSLLIRNQLIFTYKQPTVSGMVLGMAQSTELKFGCKKDLHTYQLTLINSDKTQVNILQFSESPKPL